MHFVFSGTTVVYPLMPIFWALALESYSPEKRGFINVYFFIFYDEDNSRARSYLL